MGDMKSSKRTEVSLKSSAQTHTDSNFGTELTTAWKTVAQSKVALRHIENRLEAAPGTGVVLESVIDTTKKKLSRSGRTKGHVNDPGGSSKARVRSQQSPEKSSSRSPLRNTTQDSNVRTSNSVEFREPLASYREATPPLHPSSQLEPYSHQSVPGSLYPSLLPSSSNSSSQLVYQRDTRDRQTDRDLDSTHSSALESTEVRYLNDKPALDTLRTEESALKAQFDMDSQEPNPGFAHTPVSLRQGERTPSTSPGSASLRLENLKRQQPDDKLEKLKERIRRQRRHLEEAAEREKGLSYLEQPITASAQSNNTDTSSMPTAKIRKVATAPLAPIYKGFNSAETKIQTPDGKVWREEDFHNLSREIYRDLSRQFAESTKPSHQQKSKQSTDRSKERRHPKPVRKIHRVISAFNIDAKPVTSPASWREGQKVIKMVLGPASKLSKKEDSPSASDMLLQSASHPCSARHSGTNRQSHPVSTEQPCSELQRQPKSQFTATLSAAQDEVPLGVSTDLLSSDIQGILDDLQLECRAVEKEERARKRSRGSSTRRGRGGSGSQTRTSVSSWGNIGPQESSRGCRSASPTAHQPETLNTVGSRHKKRHYDADTVRQYITRQQEERKRRQAEEKKAAREEAEKRNQRLKELYKKQREVARIVPLPTDAPAASVQKRLQETYTKLLLEEVQLGEKHLQTQPTAPYSQMRPTYQPSGESDKENKRLEAPQSPSSSDRSLNDHLPPPLTRDDLYVEGVASLLQPESLSPIVKPINCPSSSTQIGSNLLSQVLRMEAAMAAGNTKDTLRPSTAPSSRSQSKMFRIEALKATATSLSKRIESEARKLAREGINFHTPTSIDADAILASRSSKVHDGCWSETVAQVLENDNMSLRTHRILPGTGHSSEAVNLQAFMERPEKKGTGTIFTNPDTTSVDLRGPNVNIYTKERLKVVDCLENKVLMDHKMENEQYKEWAGPDLHDSSAGSISEGPLLSEGSFSEDEQSPPHSSNSPVPRPTDRSVNYSAHQQNDYQRLLDFQKEAAKCSALSSPLAQHDKTKRNKAAWEELNKGSPLSVINIFTKNLHGHVRVTGRNSERNSPSANSLHSGNGPVEAAVYEDDFVSSHASSQMKRSSNSPGPFEELMKRSSHEKKSEDIYSHNSYFGSSSHSPHLSSGSTPGSSPLSRHSIRKRGVASDQSDATLVEEQRSSCSPPSTALSSDFKNKGLDKNSSLSQGGGVQSKDSVSDALSYSSQRSGLASPFNSPGHCSPTRGSPSEFVKGCVLGVNDPNRGTSTHGDRADTRSTGGLQYSPAVLQQRMAAELQYLESIEESVRQLVDMERVMSVSIAQQESAALAQMLKAKQQRHEREVYELKVKTEREALDTKLQLVENRQRVAKAHIELQESLAATQKQALEGLQESASKMMSQQAEAAQYTADAARHIKEVTEKAQSQIAGTSNVPHHATESSQLNQREERQQLQDNAESESIKSEGSSRRARSEELLSSLSSLSHSESLSFRRPKLSGVVSSSDHSQSYVSSNHRGQAEKEGAEGKLSNVGAEKRPETEAANSSIEEEVPTAMNDSLCSDPIPSAIDEKGDSTSVATEYSIKFDESMTEDEIEEHSFRSLLPSEAHRRGTLEKKFRQHDESEDDGANHNIPLVSESRSTLKSQDVSTVFSGGQESFSQFTMEMVRQYMKDEEVRLQHQSSLLHLRQKALKEKTKTELAWLEHQKKKLRDKGEDDKMPPIRKKQRGLLLKLQQEQAEIRRLQEANKAARKERQLMLKQQEEIERMRNSTLRLKERLKCAGGQTPPETPVSESPGFEASSSNMRHAEDVRSPSPSLSVSGSETSSIMQKLKKMRSHMDEKHCSPVHYFFSVFSAHHWASLSVCLPNLHPKFQLFIYNHLVRFLTKREQQLMQRRHHAEELIQWKQHLDQEEAEVRRIEKEALAVWDPKTSQDKDLDMSASERKEIPDISSQHSHHQSSEPRTDSEKEYASESDFSVTSKSSIHTEELGAHSTELPASVPESTLTSVHSSPVHDSHDFNAPLPSLTRRSSLKGSHSPALSPSDSSSKTKMHLHSSSRIPNEDSSQPADAPKVAQTETTSDHSDIESRIKALKEELRKRKLMAYQLKKEQRKRYKERLKAQEVNLLKRLQSYDNFIEKTKAELNKEPESMADSSSILEQPVTELPAHRSESVKISVSERTQMNASLEQHALPQSGQSKSTSLPEVLAKELQRDISAETVDEFPTSGLRSHQSKDRLLYKTASLDESIISDHKSDIQEELEVEINSELEEHSLHLFKIEKEDRLDSQEMLHTPENVASSVGEHQHSSVRLEQDEQIKQRETSQKEEAEKSSISQVSPHSSYRSSVNEHFGSPDSVAVSLNNEAPIRDVEASPIADSYHDDFESPLDSSPRQENCTSKHESQISLSPNDIQDSRKDSSKALTHESQDEVVQEEIIEELSHHSGTSETSRQSGMLDLNKYTEDFSRGFKSMHPAHSPPISPLQTPLPAPLDEMPSFSIGDRVLVGGVQPGTLRFKGLTSFANGFWAGVELDKSEGSNNGSYDGVVYFECEERHGIFAPPDKVAHLPDKFELYTDTTEDEDSTFDDLSDKGGIKDNKVEPDLQNQEFLESKNEQTSFKENGSGDKVVDEPFHKSQAPLKDVSLFSSQMHYKSKHSIPNGSVGHIRFDCEDTSHTPGTSDVDKTDLVIRGEKEISAHLEREGVDSQHHFTPTDLITDVGEDKREQKNRDLLDTVSDKLFNNIVEETMKHFAEIKRAKKQKIETAKQMNGELFGVNYEKEWKSSVDQKDDLPFFLPAEKEEMSSPELYNRPQSPVLGPSGQEELAKRLAELELSRELLDELGSDDQDWFDEDFGLSSRRQQQKLKQKEEEAKLRGRLGRPGTAAEPTMGGLVSSLSGEQQVKTPPRPELPLPLPPKLPEQPAMVVPHSASEVEKMVHAATLEIWERCGLGNDGSMTLTHLPNPQPSLEYLCKEVSSQDQEAVAICSYRKAVYDLTWEMLQEIYAEDPNADQPQWVKPQRVKSSCFHRIGTPGDIAKVQEFITAEVLKLYNLAQDQNQKTDWQRILKFGRKKRDRVDHILVEELHEEEAQWVNYDEDELFVKMQLADSVFDALLKDTVNVLTLISDKRASRDNLT
ncbi:centrosome-associated protein 350 isoform 2-T2 [Pholidichthys leucotaenia]